MASKVLSIEIGANVTRICLADYKVKSPKVYKYTKVETPEGVYVDGEITVTEEFVNLLKSAISQNKMGCKQVVFPIASSKIASREITIPLVKEKKIEGMVQANASDYFPIDLTQYELGYIVLGKDAENSKYRVQVLAVPLTLLENYKQLASALGMQMVAADYSGNSIYQMVKGECREGVKMVVKADERSSIVTVIKNESIVLQRTVAYGVDDAIQTILENRAFGVSTYEEALELAVRKTCMKLSINARDVVEVEEVGEDDDATLLAAKEEVASSLNMLINGIARMMDYYTSRNGGETIDKVFITGLGADFSGLSKLLTNELGVKTVGLKHLEGQSLEKTFKDGRFGEYIACIGAVIAPVGLVPDAKGGKEKGKGKEGSDYTGVAFLLLGGGLLIAIVLLGVSIVSYLNESARFAQNVIRLQQKEEIKTIYAKYTSTSNAYNDVANMYAMTENSNEDLLAFIEEMEEKMPADIHVTSFISGLETVSMSIEVGSKEAMANAVQQLRGFNSLSNVSVMGAQEEIDDNGIHTVTFTLVGTYKTQAELKAEEAAAQAAQSK